MSDHVNARVAPPPTRRPPAEEARWLRRKGWSVDGIARRLGVRAGDVSLWLGETPAQQPRRRTA